MDKSRSIIKSKYESALQEFVNKAKKDSNIIALFSYGSIVTDELWEKSDIDIWLVSKENKKKVYNQYSLVEDDIDLQVELYSRNYFIELVDSPSNQNFFRSAMKHSILHFSTDDSIKKIYTEESYLGEREKEENLLKSGIYTVTCIKKIEKLLECHGDITELFSLMLKLVKHLSNIEVTLDNQFINQNVEIQALGLNYDFFNRVFMKLLDNKLDVEQLTEKYLECKQYFNEKSDIIFKPIIKWFKNEDDVRGNSEINEYIKRKYCISNDGNELTDSYNWLVKKEILTKTTESIKLLDSSKVSFEEAAYVYNFNY